LNQDKCKYRRLAQSSVKGRKAIQAELEGRVRCDSLQTQKKGWLRRLNPCPILEEKNTH